MKTAMMSASCVWVRRIGCGCCGFPSPRMSVCVRVCSGAGGRSLIFLSANLREVGSGAWRWHWQCCLASLLRRQRQSWHLVERYLEPCWQCGQRCPCGSSWMRAVSTQIVGQRVRWVGGGCSCVPHLFVLLCLMGVVSSVLCMVLGLFVVAGSLLFQMHSNWHRWAGVFCLERGPVCSGPGR